MSKIDWTKPIELEDGTPLVVERRVDGVRVVARADKGELPDGWNFGIFDKNGDAKCREGYTIRNVHDPESETSTENANDTDTLTVRDRFAMAALNGFCSNGANNDSEGGTFFARMAYQIADAMMEARKK